MKKIVFLVSMLILSSCNEDKKLCLEPHRVSEILSVSLPSQYHYDVTFKLDNEQVVVLSTNQPFTVGSLFCSKYGDYNK